MKSIVFAFITIFFGISIALPIKDHDIDELVLRVNELRRLNPYQGGIQQKFVKINGMDSVHRNKRTIDLDRNPTLYGYYSGVLNNIYDKRSSYDALDANNMNSNMMNADNRHYSPEKLILLENLEPSDLSSNLFEEQPAYKSYGKRNFDEIDRALIGGLKKRLFSYRIPRILNLYDGNNLNGRQMDISTKRNFDEIDRAGFTTLKRNFDEIDRAGFIGLKNKRMFLDAADRTPLLSSSASLSSSSTSPLSSRVDGISMEKRA